MDQARDREVRLAVVALAFAFVLGLATVLAPAALALRSLDARTSNTVTAPVTQGVATATFDVASSPGGPARIRVLPVPGNPAYANGTADAGWWTTVRSAPTGDALVARGGTDGVEPLELGAWNASRSYRIEVTLRLPAAAIVPGRSYMVHYAVLAPDAAPSGGASGGELEASLGLVLQANVPAPGSGGGGGAAAPEPAPGTTATATATPTVTTTVTGDPTGAARSAADGAQVAAGGAPLPHSALTEPLSLREAAMLAALLLCLGYGFGHWRARRQARASQRAAQAAQAAQALQAALAAGRPPPVADVAGRVPTPGSAPEVLPGIPQPEGPWP